MNNNRFAIGAVLLASVVAFAMPTGAHAARGGFGGGGHFGGGGMHFGGGGGHFGGGGMHFGGGGGHFGGVHFGGGGHFGGARFGGARFGGFHLGGHGLRFGGLHRGGFSHHAFGIRGLQGRRSFANLHGLSRAHGPFATHVAPAFSRRTFAHQAFFHNGFRRFGVFGWVGPLFWPYAYSDIYCDIFWGYWGYGCADPYWAYGYGDPFWDYGYGDIYGGIFSPFPFNDLAGYAPRGRHGGRRSRSEASISSSQIAQMCGNDAKEVTGWPIDRIQQLVSPNDQQRMALDDLANASTKAAQIIKDACPTSVALTPTGRLAAMQERIDAMIQAVDVVRGPLDTFYASLTDDQKAELNAANQASAQSTTRRRSSLTQNCTNANAATQWPGSQIEKALQPNETQKESLNALENAAAKAQEQLATSCPSELPTTPPARLDAVAKRLDAMLQAVKKVRVALDDFYGTLSDEQKAQFNMIGRTRTAQHQG
jgi:LTXXQ motif family protein